MQQSYLQIFSNLITVTVAYAILAPLSELLNVYLLSKWKILAKGKFFCLRSIGASTIGQFVFSVLAVLIIWHGTDLNSSVFSLALLTYLTKVIWSIIGAFPAKLVVFILRKIEGQDITDTEIKFNPFLLVRKSD